MNRSNFPTRLIIIKRCEPFKNIAAVMSLINRHVTSNGVIELICDNSLYNPHCRLISFSSIIDVGTSELAEDSFCCREPIICDVCVEDEYYTAKIDRISLSVESIQDLRIVHNIDPVNEIYDLLMFEIEGAISGLRLGEFDYSRVMKRIRNES